MDAVQQKKCIAWLEARGVSKCPVCGGEDLKLERLQCAIAFDIAAGCPDPRSVVPYVPVVCADCGHTLFFAAKIVGIVKY